MTKRHEGMCTMCLQKDVVVRNINFYTIGSEGTDLCYNYEMMVVNFINSMSSRFCDVRKDVYKRVKNMLKERKLNEL